MTRDISISGLILSCGVCKTKVSCKDWVEKHRTRLATLSLDRSLNFERGQEDVVVLVLC